MNSGHGATADEDPSDDETGGPNKRPRVETTQHGADGDDDEADEAEEELFGVDDDDVEQGFEMGVGDGDDEHAGDAPRVQDDGGSDLRPADALQELRRFIAEADSEEQRHDPGPGRIGNAVLLGAFRRMQQLWFPQQEDASTPGGLARFYGEALGVSILNSQAGETRRACERVTEEAGELWRLMTTRGYLGVDTPAGMENRSLFHRLFQQISIGGDIVNKNAEAMLVASDDRWRELGEHDLPCTHFIFKDPAEEQMNKLQTVHEYVLSIMRQHNVRRYEDEVYEQIVTVCPLRKRGDLLFGDEVKERAPADARDKVKQTDGHTALYRVDEFTDVNGTPSRTCEYTRVVCAHMLTPDGGFPDDHEFVDGMYEYLDDDRRLHAVVFSGVDGFELTDGTPVSPSPGRIFNVRGDAEAALDSEPIIIQTDGMRYDSHAWRRMCTIEEFLYDCVQKELNYSVYSMMSASGNNADHIVKWLSKRRELEFKDMLPNESHFAFLGECGSGAGIYDLAGAFFPYDKRAYWPDIARACNQFWEAHGRGSGPLSIRCNGTGPEGSPSRKDCAPTFFHEAFQEQWCNLGALVAGRFKDRLRAHDRVSVWRDGRLDFRGTFLSSEDASRARVRKDDGSEATVDEADLFAPDASPPKVVRVADKNGIEGEVVEGLTTPPHVDAGGTYRPGTADIPYDKFFPAEAEPGFNDYDARWRLLEQTILCPDVDMILTSQEMTTRTRMILMALLGRGLIRLGARDSWQVMLFLKGVGGSGKSTLLDLLQSLLPDGSVGVIANDTEQTFGLMSIWDKRLVIWPEAKSTGKILPQSDLQSMICGERMCIRIKNKAQKFIHWSSQIICAGNELPLWQDKQKCMTRRLIICPYEKPVTAADTQLPHRLKSCRGAFLARCNMAYLLTILMVGKRAIHQSDDRDEPFIGKQMKASTNAVAKSLDPVLNFLLEGDYEFEKDCWWPEQEFIADYGRFKKDRNITHFNQPYNEDLTQSAFSEYNLEVRDKPFQDPDNDESPLSRTRCILGIVRKGTVNTEWFTKTADGGADSGDE
tara:strand:+ start:178 stop:3315 length:3138 start_codon:yes stop_codon:yes gene_type:complete